MKQTFIDNNPEEWLKVLGKGMITLPKKWRDDMGIESGDVVKAKKQGDKVIIQAPKQQVKKSPYRVYSDLEIDQLLKEDIISKNLANKIKKNLSTK